MPTPVLIRALLWLWLLIALYLGHTEKLADVSAFVLPVLVLGLAAAFVFVGKRLKLVRDWFASFDLRALVLLSTTRFVGLYFLHLFTRGEMPARFAYVFGWSEALVAGSALVLGAAPLKPAFLARAVTIWNVVGCIELVLLTFNVMRLTAADPATHALFAQLPLSLWPTFLMPLLLATHILIYRRLENRAA